MFFAALRRAHLGGAPGRGMDFATLAVEARTAYLYMQGESGVMVLLT